MPQRPVIHVSRRLPAPVEARLAELFDARLNADDHPPAAGELARTMRDCDALLCTVSDRVGADVIGTPDARVRIVATFGAGVDNIDLAAARARGIVVTNTPGVLAEDTADLAVTLMLMVMRRAGEGERHLRAGAWTGWRPTHMLGARVGGKTLGIVGLGRIGRVVARRAGAGFGMRVLYHNRRRLADAEERALGVEWRASLDELLEESDVVSLHCPSTAETRHLIDAGRLARMRAGAYLINTARGDVVDEQALAEALRAGTIAGAGLDVYEREPSVYPRLLDMENVVLLPHLGSATTETRVAMGMRAIDNLVAFFRGDEPADRVA